MVSEWVIQEHPEAKVKIRARLGPLPPGAQALIAEGLNPYIMSPVRHWADALILYPDRTLLVEGKLKWNPGGLGQLLVYEHEFDRSPEYQDRYDLPLHLVALYGFINPADIEILDNLSIQRVRYCPPWVQEAYLKRVRNLR